MLVLTRKQQQEIQVGGTIKITVLKIKGQTVRLGIEAPQSVRVMRGELAEIVTSFDEEDGDELALEADSEENAETEFCCSP